MMHGTTNIKIAGALIFACTESGVEFFEKKNT
jgi:hypothetical protein